jgi:hypothetical protein
MLPIRKRQKTAAVQDAGAFFVCTLLRVGYRICETAIEFECRLPRSWGFFWSGDQKEKRRVNSRAALEVFVCVVGSGQQAAHRNAA